MVPQVEKSKISPCPIVFLTYLNRSGSTYLASKISLYADVGVGGVELFDVSEPLYIATAKDKTYRVKVKWFLSIYGDGIIFKEV